MDKVKGKKSYTTPQVIEYGDLAEITQSGNDGVADAVAAGSQFTG